jgi:hypothetical protein
MEHALMSFAVKEKSGMKSRAVPVCSLLIPIWLWLAPAARAADLSFFVGGAVPGKLRLSSVITPGQTIEELRSGPVFGIRFATNFVPLFGVEHTLAFSSDTLTPKTILNPGSARGFVYNTNLILNVPLGNLVPYATAGLGLIRQYGSAIDPSHTSFAYNYGGGLKVPRLLGPLGLRLDLRGYRAKELRFLTSAGGVNIFEASGAVLLSFNP